MLLPVKKTGRPLLVGDDLDKQIQAYIIGLRKGHCTVNTAIVISAGEGIIMGHDPSLLVCNGGSMKLTKDWAKGLMQRMGLSKHIRLPQNHVCHSMIDFEKVREIFLNDVAAIVVMDEIPIH